NLRRWLSRPNCPDVIRRCKTLFDKLYGEKQDRTAHIQELAFADDDSSKPHVILHARYRADGVIYARAETHLGNSLILFYPQGVRTSSAIPGSIQYIYSVDGHLRFAVRPYSALALGSLDPFVRYPDFPARTWSTQGTNTLEEVEVSWVFCHFAQYSISDAHVVVLALSQVSNMIHFLFVVN
ncbi:hypothetical protein LXA43DRAFT_905041, partial [Ganoderma leucocontextum]